MKAYMFALFAQTVINHTQSISRQGLALLANQGFVGLKCMFEKDERSRYRIEVSQRAQHGYRRPSTLFRRLAIPFPKNHYKTSSPVSGLNLEASHRQ